MINPFADLRILTSPHAYKIVVTDERLFPASRHRSKRVHKKLIKRYGGEFKVIHKPAIWKMRDKSVMHPTLFEELKKRDRARP